MAIIMKRFFNDLRKSSPSEIPIDRPSPMIGPMSGEISMAPMMTAVELTLRPTEAMIIAKKSTHTLSARNSTPLVMLAIVVSESVSSAILARDLMYVHISLIICNIRSFIFLVVSIEQCEYRFSTFMFIRIRQWC